MSEDAGRKLTYAYDDDLTVLIAVFRSPWTGEHPLGKKACFLRPRRASMATGRPSIVCRAPASARACSVVRCLCRPRTGSLGRIPTSPVGAHRQPLMTVRRRLFRASTPCRASFATFTRQARGIPHRIVRHCGACSRRACCRSPYRRLLHGTAEHRPSGALLADQRDPRFLDRLGARSRQCDTRSRDEAPRSGEVEAGVIPAPADAIRSGQLLGCSATRLRMCRLLTSVDRGRQRPRILRPKRSRERRSHANAAVPGHDNLSVLRASMGPNLHPARPESCSLRPRAASGWSSSRPREEPLAGERSTAQDPAGRDVAGELARISMSLPAEEQGGISAALDRDRCRRRRTRYCAPVEAPWARSAALTLLAHLVGTRTTDGPTSPAPSSDWR
jgi:hypothetical protein